MVNFWARWNVNGFCQGAIVLDGFSMFLFTSEALLSMAFHISTIGINGFFQWFLTVEPSISMGFLTVEPLASMVFFTVEPLVLMIFQWFG